MRRARRCERKAGTLSLRSRGISAPFRRLRGDFIAAAARKFFAFLRIFACAADSFDGRGAAFFRGIGF